MNRLIKVYTELDSLYDYRRGLLQWLLTEGITDDELRKREGDRLWNLHIDKNYRERRMDTFEYPGLKINAERFKALYKERTLTNFLMYYPTKLSRNLLSSVIDLEQLTDVPITIQGVVLYLNLFPYVFDEELKQDLVEHLGTLFGGRVEVKLIDEDMRKADGSYYRQYNYVFKYNLLGEENRVFQETMSKHPNPETAFIIPDVLNREADAFAGSVKDWMFAWSLSVAQVARFIPVGHDLYDFET